MSMIEMSKNGKMTHPDRRQRWSLAQSVTGPERPGVEYKHDLFAPVVCHGKKLGHKGADPRLAELKYHDCCCRILKRRDRLITELVRRGLLEEVDIFPRKN